ncbi:MAG: chitobiase/beta-hexosaminidase C-terminal domain-containing protein [Bacteroidales bacterium]|nr:chitobiase/beta-hexosaminidase C-terminal domain-containing protein [Bacteroidales bacterium]
MYIHSLFRHSLAIIFVISCYILPLTAQTTVTTTFDSKEFSIGPQRNYVHNKSSVEIKIANIEKKNRYWAAGKGGISIINITVPRGATIEQIKIQHPKTTSTYNLAEASSFNILGTFTSKEYEDESSSYDVWRAPNEKIIPSITITKNAILHINAIQVIWRRPEPPKYQAITYNYNKKHYFIDTLLLHLSSSEGVIRYTTDGSPPTAESPLYTSPIRLTTATTLQATTFTLDGLYSDVQVFKPEPFPFVGNGSREKPYSLEDIDFITQAKVTPISNVPLWVAGRLIGSLNAYGKVIKGLHHVDNIILGYQTSESKPYATFSLDGYGLAHEFSAERFLNDSALLYGYFTYDTQQQCPTLTPEGFESLVFLGNGHEHFTLSELGYTTFTTRYPYSIPPGIQGAIALEVKGRDIGFDWIYTTDDIVPAGQALLLRGALGTYANAINKGSSLKPTKSIESTKHNLLLGNSSTTPFLTTDVTKVYYGLSYDIHGLGFYRRQDDGQAIIPPYRCVLALPHSDQAAYIHLDNDITHIKSIKEAPSPYIVYSLTGQVVGTTSQWHVLPQGLYIVNRNIVVK